MSSISKEIEKAVQLKTQIEEERPKAEEYETAIRYISELFASYTNAPDIDSIYDSLFYQYYMDQIQSIVGEVYRVSDEIKYLNCCTYFSKLADSKETALKITRSSINSELEGATNEKAKEDCEEKLRNFENAVTVISNATIKESGYLLANRPIELTNFNADTLNKAIDLAYENYSQRVLNSANTKLKFYDNYIGIIKFNKKLESLSDEDIIELYASMPNITETLRNVDKVISDFEKEKETLNKELEKTKSEVKIPSAEEIENDEKELKNIYDNIAFLGINPEQNQRYISFKEALSRKKAMIENPESATEYSTEVLNIESQITEINKKIDAERNRKSSIKENIKNMSREEIENRLREASGLDFETLNILKNSHWLQYQSHVIEQEYYIDQTRNKNESNIKYKTEKIEHDKFTLSRMLQEKASLETSIAELDSIIEERKSKNEAISNFYNDPKLNYLLQLGRGYTMEQPNDLTQEEINLASSFATVESEYEELITGLGLKESNNPEANFRTKTRNAQEARNRYDSWVEKLNNPSEKLSFSEKHQLKKTISTYEKERKTADDEVIEKNNNFNNIIQKYISLCYERDKVILNYAKLNCAEAYEALKNINPQGAYSYYGNTICGISISWKLNNGSPYYGAPLYGLREQNELRVSHEYRLNNCNSQISEINESIETLEAEIKQLQEENAAERAFLSRVKNGEVYPSSEEQALYKQLDTSELDVNSEEYESEFKLQLGIEEESVGKTR